MSSRAIRAHPLARVVLVVFALGILTALCAMAGHSPSAQASAPSGDDIAQGEKLFAANCSTCHGKSAQGGPNAPSLVGVGAAAVDFQVGTGRMPMQINGPQAPRNSDVKFSESEISQLSSYVASLAPGPAIPDAAALSTQGADIAAGRQAFITNCAMCHNFAGSGGVLTAGKWAPSLEDVADKHIYEAMITGPQSMPVFNDQTLTPETKRNIIAYLNAQESEPSPGGITLGSIGPVSEGLLAWVFILPLLIAFAVWLGAKSS